MSTHSTCFHGEIRKISVVSVGKSAYLELHLSTQLGAFNPSPAEPGYTLFLQTV